MSGAWTPAKVDAFKKAFFDFLKVVKINSKEKGGSYILADGVYEAQRRFLDGVFGGLAEDKHDFSCLKSRQLGVSTISRALVVFYMGVTDGIQGAAIMDTDVHKEEYREEVEGMIDNLPAFVKFPRIKKRNRNMLTLSNGSVLRFLSAGVRESKSGGVLGRSSGINLVHASELCSWQNEEGVTALKNAMAEDFPDRLYIWESPLALDTPLPTPTGWTTMGETKKGDILFDDQGKACRVVGTSPVFSDRDCYRIKFSNGDEIVADAQHKWQVEERRWPTNPQWKTKIVATSAIDPNKHRILVGKPLDLPNAKLPIDPYVLGVWLGDGRTDNPTITAGDEDIDELRTLVGHRGYDLGATGKYDWRVGKFTLLRQRPAFNNLGLLGNKHIPAAYLRASESQRRDLLAGLMDTDGHISKKNFRAEYCSILPHLIDEVSELLATLGIKFNRSGLSEEGNLRTFPSGKTYACRASERLRFCEYPHLKVFNLERKRTVHSDPERGFTWRKSKFLKIVSVTRVPSVLVKCIEVDSPSHLFLAGKTMIPTHNTARGFNRWHSMWEEAKADTLNKVTIFIGWWAKDNQKLERGTPAFAKYAASPITDKERIRIAEVKERYGWEVTLEQLAWYRRKTDPALSKEDDDDDDQFTQQDQPWTEDEAFVMSGSSFFSSEKLTDRAKEATREKYSGYRYFPGTDFTSCDFQKARSPKDSQLKIWEEPDPNGIYVVAADPAYGHDENNDRSACQVLRCYADCIEQVAEFASASTPTNQFAWLIASLVGYYKNIGSLIIEINGPGEAVWNEYKSLRQLVQTGYLRGPAQERGLRDVFNNVRNYIFSRSDSMSSSNSYQWKTTTQLKVAIMERLRDFANSGQLFVRSIDTIEEMRAVTRNGDVIKAEGRKKDDRVMAIAMGIRAWEERVRKAQISGGQTKKAEIARRAASPQSRANLLSQYQFESFFRQKASARVQAKIAARRASRYR